MGKIYINEAGIDLILDTGINIGTVNNYAIEWKNPDGTTGTFAASLYNSYSALAAATGTYLLKFTLKQASIGISGEWEFQAWCAAVDGTWYGETVKLDVYGLFE